MVGSSACPFECQTTSTTNAGTLKISSDNIAVESLAPGVKYVGSIKLTATDQDIVINGLTLQKVGSFTKGWIEQNGINIANIDIGNTDNTIAITLSPGMVIKQGTSKTLSVFVDGDNGQNQ